MASFSDLPDEIVEYILEAFFGQTWLFNERADILLTCKRFHRLGRRFLYRNVLVSTVKGFHCFFLVDAADWEAENRQYGNLFDEEVEAGERWSSEMNRTCVERRRLDWRIVEELTIDLSFSPWSYDPIVRALPLLTNTFGRAVSLQYLPSAIPLLPNLHTLIERTTCDYEDYDVYRAQTYFRFTFYGCFSPRIFKMPLFPSPADRFLNEKAMRFPSSFLSKSEVIHIRDLVDLLDFFPLLQLPPNKISKDGLGTVEAVPAFSVNSISDTVTTIICENEDFGYQMGPIYFKEYFEIRIPLAVQQFPNLKHLHLPALHAFYLINEGKSDHFQRMYEQAVLKLKSHEDSRVKKLEIRLDQEVS